MPTLPAEITAIEISSPGGPEVLKPAKRPMPVPGLGEVLIRVEAAGVNRPDLMQRKGGYPPPQGASDIPGLEVAGEIVALGPGTNRFKLGERVCALVTGGGYATFCTAPEAQCLQIPGQLGAVEAAGLPETFFTVWTNLFMRAGLRAGERVLIHGGTSGIGTTAIQLARAFGARVFATAGSDEKCAACLTLGAEGAINYRAEPFEEAVLKLTGGEGVDVVLDMVGGSYIARDMKALRPEGRLALIAVQEGAKAEINLVVLMQKRLMLTGSTLRPQSVEAKARIAAGLQSEVWPLIAAGAVKPVIDRTYSLAQASEAHARLESGQHIGKVILTV
ncbi:MAG: NAD(P)H-quinone oxidoreductase [Alphaproteobacteria bacterium]|nr:NAD(P)H-quinone oxidoreductase [Alphaproteobacteria bacterium]